MNLPQYMHMKRREQRRTLESVCSGMSVSKSQLSRYERGLCPITHKILCSWVVALGLSVPEQTEARRLFVEGRQQ